MGPGVPAYPKGPLVTVWLNSCQTACAVSSSPSAVQTLRAGGPSLDSSSALPSSAAVCAFRSPARSLKMTSI